jgi:Flp pilus assembly protein TadG
MRRRQLPISRIRRNLRSRTRIGAAAVEFALVAPVFIVIVFICIEFCRLNMIRNLTNDAAYFAARNAMVPGATADEAIAAANEVLGYMNTQGATVIINEEAGLNEDSEVVSVTVNVPVSENSFLVPQFTGDMTISATATMRTERYDGFYDPDLG